MTDKMLRMVFSAQDNATSKMSKLSLAITGINQALEITRKVAEAAKKVFEFAEEGAQIQLTERRFSNLAKSIGVTADTLKTDLKIALKGTKSDLEAMSLVTDLVGLGLVKTEDEAIRMANVVSELGMDTNQLVLTLTNQTTARFDQLGVSVDGFKERVKELEKAGHDTNEAFKLAFIEQAEDQIKRVGSSAESSAGQFKILRSHVADWWNEVKTGAANIITPIIEATNKQLAYNDVLKELNKIYRDNSWDMADYRQIVVDVGMGTLDEEEATKLLIEALEKAKKKFLELNPEAKAYSVWLGANVDLTKELAEKSSTLDVALDILTNGFTLEKLEAWEVAHALEAQLAAMEALRTKAKQLNTVLSDLTKIGYDPYEGNVPGGGGGGSGSSSGSTSTGGGWNIPGIGYVTKASGAHVDSSGNLVRNGAIIALKGRFAGGGEFTVPAGFPNDSYTIGVQSGEHVKVTPAGKKDDTSQLVDEVRRLVRILPTALKDAVARA